MKKPYHIMVLEMHRENQRRITAYERAGYFDPICPWFDIDLDSDHPVPLCRYSSPFLKGCGSSCCPTGWLS